MPCMRHARYCCMLAHLHSILPPSSRHPLPPPPAIRFHLSPQARQRPPQKQTTSAHPLAAACCYLPRALACTPSRSKPTAPLSTAPLSRLHSIRPAACCLLRCVAAAGGLLGSCRRLPAVETRPSPSAVASNTSPAPARLVPGLLCCGARICGCMASSPYFIYVLHLASSVAPSRRVAPP